jgi:hypothetical protein
MTRKNLALAASIMAMVAISGQAFAGSTKANPSRDAVSPSTAQAARAARAFNASHAAMDTGTVAVNTHPYHGGPKVND